MIVEIVVVTNSYLQDEISVGVFEGLMAGSSLTKQEYQELRSTLSQNCM